MVAEPDVAPGRRVAVSTGRRDPLATPSQTTALVSRLRRAGAVVGEFPHDAGHTIDERLLPDIRRFISRA